MSTRRIQRLFFGIAVVAVVSSTLVGVASSFYREGKAPSISISDGKRARELRDLMKKDDVEKLRARLETFVALNPDDDYARSLLIRTLFRAGQWKSASEQIHFVVLKGRRVVPEPFWLELGAKLSATGDGKGALSALEDSGTAYFRFRKFDFAREALTQIRNMGGGSDQIDKFESKIAMAEQRLADGRKSSP
jgi:hypothetical protein